MSLDRITIFIAGASYTALLYYFIGSGTQMFGVYATIGGLLLHLLWKRSELSFLSFLRKYAFNVFLIFLGIVFIPYAFSHLGDVAMLALIIALPAYVTLGLSWFIFGEILFKWVFGRFKPKT